METTEFVTWFSSNAGRLRRLPAGDAADELSAQLERLDPRLGVEVGQDDDDPSRELIVTAFADESLFDAVRHLVAALRPRVPGSWSVVGLKPPRGFDFVLELGDHQLRASTMRYSLVREPYRGVELHLGLTREQLAAMGEDADELAWLVLETGVGEVLAASVEDVRFVSTSDPATGAPIEELMSELQDD